MRVLVIAIPIVLIASVLVVPTAIEDERISRFVSGVLIFLVLLVTALIFRLFRGYVRDRDEFARRFDFRICPKCLREVEPEGDSVLKCPACDLEYDECDVVVHFQRDARHWGKPAPLWKGRR